MPINKYGMLKPAIQFNTTVKGACVVCATGTANRNLFPSGETSQADCPPGASNSARGVPAAEGFPRICTAMILPPGDK